MNKLSKILVITHLNLNFLVREKNFIMDQY